MRLRARLCFFLGAGCSAACLTAAITFVCLQGPGVLLRHWPDYYRAMAEREPHQDAAWFTALLALEPRDSEAQLRVAAAAEWQGDLGRARALLEQAAAHDARFRMQWALLEFETRHASPSLWTTARRCFQMSYGDRRMLLETVWQLRPDASFLLAQVIPDSPPVLFYATSFLMEQGDLAGARQAFARLISLPPGSPGRANAGIVATAVERAHLGLDLTDLHLDRLEPRAALAIWRSLADAGLLRVDGAREAGRQVMNPLFRTDPTGRGFDWRVLSSPDVEMRRADGGWRVDLAGNHPPDRVALIEQRVIWNGEATPEVASNAPAWVRAGFFEEGTGREILSRDVGPRTVRLRIEYRRPPGRPPLREPLVIRGVRWRTV